MRVGLIGTGYWARDTHAPALAGSPHAELVGVWGRRAEAVAQIAAGVGTRAYDDLDRLLADVDAAVLAVPPAVQASLAPVCAAAGVHLLLEKPLATQVDAAERVVEAVDAAGVAALVFFTSRFRPEQRRWIEVARERTWHTAHASWVAHVYEPSAPPDAGDWRQVDGALFDIGCHAVSVALGTLGRVESVVAGRGIGDTVHFVARHSSGASSTTTVSMTAPARATQSLFTVFGDAGVVSMPTPLSPPIVAARSAVADLAELVRTGERRHDCDVHVGLDVVRVLAAVRESLGTGAAVTVA